MMGDFNAHIGILGEALNQNGRQLKEWLEGKDAEILNLTMGLSRATLERNEQKSAINFIIVNSRARGRIKKFWIDEGEFDVGSDHKMI